MPPPRDRRNVAAVHGSWGESVAVEFLRRRGYEILDRNARPCRRDRRLGIDIVAYERATDTLVFVEVKQHAEHSPWERRLRSVDRRKRRNLRVVFDAWRRRNRWETGYRFDVIEIFGEPGDRMPEIDHVVNVGIFTPSSRFVRWEER